MCLTPDIEARIDTYAATIKWMVNSLKEKLLFLILFLSLEILKTIIKRISF